MTTDTAPAPRRRGRPPRIDRDKIIAAAREIAPDQLTMQAVADRLGVHRNAVHYYVSDREGLLRLLATHAIENGPADYVVDDAATWQDTLLSFSAWLKENYLAAGELITHFRFETPQDAAGLVPVEHVLTVLTRSGFEPVEAARALVMISTITLGYARDVVLAGADLHPQQRQIIDALERSERPDLPSLESLARARFSLADESQLEFDLDVLLRGLEARLEAGGGPGGPGAPTPRR